MNGIFRASGMDLNLINSEMVYNIFIKTNELTHIHSFTKPNIYIFATDSPSLERVRQGKAVVIHCHMTENSHWLYSNDAYTYIYVLGK